MLRTWTPEVALSQFTGLSLYTSIPNMTVVPRIPSSHHLPGHLKPAPHTVHILVTTLTTHSSSLFLSNMQKIPSLRVRLSTLDFFQTRAPN